MKFNYKYQVLTLLCSCWLIACSSGYTTQIEEMEAGYISMQLNAKARGYSDNEFLNEYEPVTRASDVINSEEQISNLQIFFFDYTTGDLIWKPEQSNLSYNTKGLLKLTIPSLDIRQSLSVAKVMLYVVSNTDQLSVSNEYELLNHRVIDTEFVVAKQPKDFVMIGSQVAQIRFVGNASDIGMISLNRLAAKIEPVFPQIPNEGIQISNERGDKVNYVLDGRDAVGVCFHGVNSSSILDIAHPEYNDPQLHDMHNYHSVEKNNSAHFYSYSHSWERYEDGAFLTYRLRLRRTDNGDTRNFYYKVPITSNLASGLSQDSGIKPNHHYLVIPRIETLGATEPDQPIWVDSQFAIWGWTMNNIDSSITDAHYFMVQETDVKMPNINEYQIKFVSTSSVRLKEVKDAWHWVWKKKSKYSEDLYAEKKKMSSHDFGYPRVYVRNTDTEKKIIINADIPNNFSPSYFTLVLEDEKGLTETITVEQYPARYITGERSEEKDKDPFVYYAHDYGLSAALREQNNFNLFTVTTLAGGEEFNGKRYRIGDPTYRRDGKVYTYEDYEHNQLVSPRFVIASQRSIYYRTMYNRSYYSSHVGRTILSARERCANYAEGGYGVGTWRLPTEAELEYLYDIQNSGKSPVTNLVDGFMYWSGATYRYFIFKKENSYYDGAVGFFGSRVTPDENFQNDSYYIQPNHAPVYISNSPSAPHYQAFVDPSGIDGRWPISSKFYYSSFVRCVRDI